MNRKQRRAAERRAGFGSASGAGLDIDKVLVEAVRHHQAGRLQRAEASYRRVLAAHPDAEHLLGVIAHQTDRNDIAVALIGKAIAANPGVALYHNNMAAAMHFRHAAELDPDAAIYHNNLGNVAVRDEVAERFATVPYRANTLVTFVNTPDSIHGVSERGVTAHPRRYINFLAELREPLLDLSPYQE